MPNGNRGTQLEITVVRVLIVDDSPLWRDLLCRQLEGDPNLSVIALASDGSGAVRKAGELQPDLVLLDVRLPQMDGISAAREIRRISPRTTILMVSCESHPAIVQAALHAGACGYVYKFAAGKDLLAGIETVLAGGQFLSRALAEPETLF